ncbi:MAG: hypothetical protein WCJ59_00785 [bacterium]
METFQTITNSPEIRRENEILKIEQTLSQIIPSKSILEIFGNETYLIGGIIRDVILNKNTSNSDIDIMTRAEPRQIIHNLHINGFAENLTSKFSTNKYSINTEANVINLLIENREVQAGLIGSRSISELINSGDLNINCCAFDIYNKYL